MTTFGDVIQSGNVATTSALSSVSPTMQTRTFRFTVSGGSPQTLPFMFPSRVRNIDAKLYIEAQGSAATTDKITMSAAGQDLITFSSIGSATGILRQTTVGLGVLTAVASACANLNNVAEVSAAITLASVDTAAVYQVQVTYNRRRAIDTIYN